MRHGVEHAGQEIGTKSALLENDTAKTMAEPGSQEVITKSLMTKTELKEVSENHTGKSIQEMDCQF